MRRAARLTSGIAVALLAVLNVGAVAKMIFYYQQIPSKIPLISIISLGVTALVVALSFIGAYILILGTGWSK